MLTIPSLAHNMQLVVTAILADKSQELFIDANAFKVSDFADGMQYCCNGDGFDTFDDRNDAIFAVMSGDYDFAFMVLPNVNYHDDQVDVLIFSKVNYNVAVQDAEA